LNIPNALPRSIDDTYWYFEFPHIGMADSTEFMVDVVQDILAAEVLIIGGGGGGGGGENANRGSGGGGAGGLIWIPSVDILRGTYEIIVGNGGKAGPGSVTSNTSANQGSNGAQSSFLGYLAVGGGAGGGASGTWSIAQKNGLVGGSGGGGADFHGDGASGLQSAQSLTHGYGNSGGHSRSGDHYMGGAGGGGGGAGGPGQVSGSGKFEPGAGGDGMEINITGMLIEYARGGNGSSHNILAGMLTSADLGNGGNAGGRARAGMDGGSGIVIIRHKIWCTACVAGTYKADKGTAQCQSCPNHSDSPASSISIIACTCNAGWTGPDGGLCTQCVAGKYKIASGDAACSNCSAGQYSAANGATSNV